MKARRTQWFSMMRIVELFGKRTVKVTLQSPAGHFHTEKDNLAKVDNTAKNRNHVPPHGSDG